MMIFPSVASFEPTRPGALAEPEVKDPPCNLIQSALPTDLTNRRRETTGLAMQRRVSLRSAIP